MQLTFAFDEGIREPCNQDIRDSTRLVRSRREKGSDQPVVVFPIISKGLHDACSNNKQNATGVTSAYRATAQTEARSVPQASTEACHHPARSGLW